MSWSLIMNRPIPNEWTKKRSHVYYVHVLKMEANMNNSQSLVNKSGLGKKD